MWRKSRAKQRRPLRTLYIMPAGKVSAGTEPSVLLGMSRWQAGPLDGQTACTPCAPGQYQDVDGQALCKPCESGKFQAGAGATACELCPVGKQQRFEESSICDDCFPGKYAAQPGSLACAWCAAGTLPNVARTVCESCAAGTYRVNLRDTQCHSCDYCNNVMLEAVGCGFDSRGSCQPCAQCTNPNETRTVCDGTCLCVPGRTRSEAGVCELCAAGKAKAAPGDGPCTDCGLGRYSPAGSSACLDCAIGTYSALAVAPACVPCGENKTTENIRSHSEELCVCDLGFHHVASEPSLCNACLPGTWNDKLNHHACSLCEAGKFLDGYAANSSEHCEVCALNTYALAGADECEKCPYNGTSPTGSVSVGNCTCPAGAEGDGLGNCWCTAGFMRTGQDIPLCMVCAVGQFCSGRDHNASCADGECTQQTPEAAGSASTSLGNTVVVAGSENRTCPLEPTLADLEACFADGPGVSAIFGKPSAFRLYSDSTLLVADIFEPDKIRSFDRRNMEVGTVVYSENSNSQSFADLFCVDKVMQRVYFPQAGRFKIPYLDYKTKQIMSLQSGGSDVMLTGFFLFHACQTLNSTYTLVV